MWFKFKFKWEVKVKVGVVLVLLSVKCLVGIGIVLAFMWRCRWVQVQCAVGLCEKIEHNRQYKPEAASYITLMHDPNWSLGLFLATANHHTHTHTL